MFLPGHTMMGIIIILTTTASNGNQTKRRDNENRIATKFFLFLIYFKNALLHKNMVTCQPVNINILRNIIFKLCFMEFYGLMCEYNRYNIDFW